MSDRTSTVDPGGPPARPRIANPIELASDRGRGARGSGVARVERVLAPAAWAAVEQGAGALGADPGALLAAVLAALLHRHTQQSEVTVGAWRDGGGGEALLVPVPFPFDDRTSFRDLASAASPGGAFAAPAVGQAGESFPSHALFAGGFAGPGAPPVPPGGLSLSLGLGPGGRVLRLDHDAGAFDRPRMEELLEQYALLLDRAARDPSLPVLEPELLTERGRSLLPDPALPLELPRYPLLTEAFLACAARWPEQIAIRQSGRTWTYAALQQVADGLARELVRRGVRPGDAVAVTGQRSFALVGAMLAVFRSGGVLLTLDPRLPPDRQRTMIQQAGATRLLCVGGARLEGGYGVEEIRVEPEGELSQAADAAGAALPELRPEWPAYVFFTSGSTGVPKAVCGRHAGLAHFLDWQRRTFEIGPGDRASQLTALSFDVVLRDMFLALTSGAELCIPGEGDVLEPARILRWLAQERITVLHVVPSLMRLWLNYVPAGMKLEELRRAFFAGEPLTDVLVKRFREALAPQATVINLYGPTETTLAKCFHVVSAEPDPGIQPIGRPQPQTQVLILNRLRRRCGLNEVGEIAIRTPFRTLGYLNAPEANAKAFIPNPSGSSPEDLVYLTGDSGRYRTDGLLEILGRIDNQVKIRGMRVEPGEIEAVLGRHPGVREAVVVAQEDASGGKALVAYVVRRGAEGEAAEAWVAGLREFLRQRLPEHMVPGAFVGLEALPLNPNGKVNKKALPPPGRAAWGGPAYAPPSDDLEVQLLGIWRKVLQVERLGVEDRFFDVGGHSLLAVQLAAEIAARLGRPCPLPLVFEAPTVRSLAARLRDLGGGGDGARLVELRGGGEGPRLYCICGVHLYQELADAVFPDFRTSGIFLPLEQEMLTGPERGRSITVEQMAAAYLQVIRAHQPHGPYSLAGVSFGGVLAYEIAQQLARDGERVEVLAMLDSMLPRALRRDWGRWALDRLRRLRDGELRLQELAGRAWSRLARRRAGPAATSGPSIEERTRRLEELRDALYRGATRHYAPAPYAGPALLVRADDKSFFQSDIADATYGWGGLIEALEIRDMPGGHLGILHAPNVTTLAELLRAHRRAAKRGP